MTEISFTDIPDDEGLELIEEGFESYAESCGVVCGYRDFTFTAREDGRTVGLLSGHSYYKEAHVSELIVHKDYRGKDIGTKLLEAAEEHFRREGLENIELTTHAFQAPEFYRKCGFRVEFVRKSESDEKLDKYFMVKKL